MVNPGLEDVNAVMIGKTFYRERRTTSLSGTYLMEDNGIKDDSFTCM